MRIDEANQLAVKRILDSQPVLIGIAPAAEMVPGMRRNLIFHAGPPITWDRMSGPLRGAVIGGLIFEGLATDEPGAVGLVEQKQVQFAPCHHHGAVGPMAGVTTASMPVYIIENRAFGTRAYSNLNERYGKVLRYGAYGEEVLARLRWLRDDDAPTMVHALKR